MSRRRNKSGGTSVTVHLDPDMAMQLDQWQNQFGLDSRSLAAQAMMKAGVSAVPLDTAVFEICMAAVREHRRAESEALLEHYEKRIAMYRGTRG